MVKGPPVSALLLLEDDGEATTPKQAKNSKKYNDDGNNATERVGRVRRFSVSTIPHLGGEAVCQSPGQETFQGEN